jgi:hypothetical protein
MPGESKANAERAGGNLGLASNDVEHEAEQDDGTVRRPRRELVDK